ncbi:hypothetical protein BY458DRAFT_439419 [Sporodiniella umbellata]|nr:hypothetical protein BY458DRAFT_439419 [Sporodiniella umbellata]
MVAHAGPHYAVCLFSRDSSTSFYEYGTMIRLDHVDTSPDQAHTVIQAVGLFRVKVNRLSLDQAGRCYYGDMMRLDDREIPHSEENRWLPPIITQTPPLSPIHRSRPSSMRQSPSSPTFRPAEAYLPFTRPSWNHLNLTPPWPVSPLLNTFLAPSLFPLDPCTLALVDALLLKLHPCFLKHLVSQKAHLTQYQWYLDHKPQSTEALLWWLVLTLPFPHHQKLELYGKNTLYERAQFLVFLCQSL